jgi:hypothetical protein
MFTVFDSEALQQVRGGYTADEMANILMSQLGSYGTSYTDGAGNSYWQRNDGSSSYPYSQEQSGSGYGDWQGGYVYGWGYIAPDVFVYGTCGYGSGNYGGYTGTIYSVGEYNAMVASGAWRGGVVAGSGYIAENTVVFSGSGNYYTMSEYLNLHNVSALGNIINAVIGAIPFVGDYAVYMGSQMRSMYDSTKSQLTQMGYTNTDLLFVSQVSDYSSNLLIVRVYDASSGKQITESSMNALGWWTTSVVY